jgi:hypothetical protein
MEIEINEPSAIIGPGFLFALPPKTGTNALAQG